MATDPSQVPSMWIPPDLRCHYCNEMMLSHAKFCSACGKPRPGTPPDKYLKPPQTMRGTVIKDGQVQSPADVSSYPLPAAPLKLVEQSAPAPLAQMPDTRSRPLAGRFPVQPRPLSDSTGRLLQRVFADERNDHGLFKNSGPLEKTAKMASVKKPTPEEQLPDWLKPATAKQAAVTPDFLLSSGKSVPLLEDPKPAAAPVFPVRPYPPQPDGTDPCGKCHGSGLSYAPNGDFGPCLAPGCHFGRVKPVPVIPQPLPDDKDKITGSDMTPEDAAVARSLAGITRLDDPATTGPTDLALEAVQVETPARPQTTDPIVELQEAELQRRLNVEDQCAHAMEYFRRLKSEADTLDTTLSRAEWVLEAMRETKKHIPHGQDLEWELVINNCAELVDRYHAQDSGRMHRILMQADFGTEHLENWDEQHGALAHAQREGRAQAQKFGKPSTEHYLNPKKGA